jgi:hypothetical protein
MDHPSDQSLSDAQRQSLSRLRENFAKEVGAANQDPADPRYLSLWQDAQWFADQQFRALFGAQAFASRQKQAALEAMQRANP